MTPLLLAVVLLAQRADTIRYAIILSGNRAGSEVPFASRMARSTFFQEYNDRGRGPKLESRFTLTAGGMPRTLSITGNDYLKVPVEERFTLRGDSAEWSSSAERGSRHLVAPAFYVIDLRPSSADFMLAQAAATAANGRDSAPA